MQVRMIAGVVPLLVYGLGLLDQINRLTNRDSYLESLSEEARAYAMSFPDWFAYAWVIATVAGLAGAIALIARMQASVVLFAVSFVALVTVTVYTYAFARSPLVMDALHLAISGGLLVLGAAAIWAAWRLTSA